MPDGFDPYLQWLGIREAQRPPNHYRLLGLALFEADPKGIAQAAEQRMTHVRTYQHGPYVAASQHLIGEIAAARLCLLNPNRKATYDAWLRRELGLPADAATCVEPSAPAPVGPQEIAPRNVEPYATAIPEPRADETNEESPVMSWAITILTFVVLVLIGSLVLVLNRSRGPVDVARPASSSSEIEEPSARESPPQDLHVLKADDVPEEPSPPPASRPAPPREPTSPPAPPPAPPAPSATPPTVSAPASKTEPPAPAFKMEPLPPAPAAPVRAAVPDAAAQKKALDEIRSVLREEYSKADRPDGRRALADLLLRQAIETRDDPIAQYVLLCEARDQAIELGEVELFLQTLTALLERFVIDEIAMKADVLANASRRTKPTAGAALAALAMETVQEAVRADRFAEAERLLESAKELARRGKDFARLKEAVAYAREMDNLKRQFAQAREAAKSLAATPDDPAANLAVGRYVCLVRGDWPAGSVFLEKGDDEPLKQLARSERNAPTTSDQTVALGNAWWEASARAGPEWQRLYRSRAAFWYRQALPTLSGMTKSRVDRRLLDLGEPVPQRPKE